MQKKLKKKKNRFEIKTQNLLILCTFICILSVGMSLFTKYDNTAISSVANFVLSPMQKGINKISDSIISVYNRTRSVNELSKENNELKERIQLLEKDINNLKNGKNEFERIEKQLNFIKNVDYDYQISRIIASDTNNWFNSFTIDKGSTDGIEKDMNVISNGSLVGIVTNVSPNSSIVRAIIDDLSAVSCVVEGKNNLLMLEGNLINIKNGFLRGIDINYNAELNVGDKIVTSGISKKFLPDIPIGFVSEVTKDENLSKQEIKVVPNNNFNSLREVIVIKKKKDIGIDNEGENK